MIHNQKREKVKVVLKTACVLPIFLAIVCAATLGVNAYLKLTAVVENTFIADVSETPIVNETFSDNKKSKVSMNAGKTEYSVYVRAAIVAVWVNDAGKVHANVPVIGKDYQLELNIDANGSTDKGWFEKDGFYYHKTPVVSEANTEDLIIECKPLKAAPLDKEAPATDIYKLKVDIVTQTIQAAGMTDDETNPIPAVTAAWGVNVNNNDKTLTQ